MTMPLRVLLLEDKADDAVLVLRELRRAGYEPDSRRVETESEFIEALGEGFELILADFHLPRFSGLRALEILRARGDDVPFILVSGTIGEETAVESMRLGATDFLLKDRLARLGPAVKRALTETRLRAEREKALEALRLFRALVDESSDAFEVIDLHTGRFIDVNESECRELGYTRAEILEKAVWDIDPTVDAAKWADFVYQIRNGGQVTGEAAHRRRDGTIFPVEFSSRLVRLDRDYVVAVVRNIAERKEAEEALRTSEERFRQMADNIDEVFWMTDLAKKEMLYISPGYERIWGRACADLYANPRTWAMAIVPEDRARVMAAAAARQATGQYREEYRIMRPDGSVRWIFDQAFPVRDEHGAVYRVVGVARDITDKKLLEEQFLHAQRLEAIGTLAGGVAHDLNNILAPVLMVSGLLKTRLTDERDINALTMVEASAKRGAAIIRQLLTFSRGLSGEHLPVQLRHLIKEMNTIMTETFPREITIVVRAPHDLWPVMADATQMHQVLMNLCVNARDAMGGGGALTVSAQNTILSAEEARMQPDAHAGRYVVVSVEDTGHGIPQAIVDRIFEPFFTTKELGKGTGLGLSTVLGIVRSHRGFVTVTSSEGGGTTFRVYFPAAPEHQASGIETEGGVSPRGHNELVLVVDDEVHVRDMTCLVLEAHGYRVIGAGNGKEAVMRFLENQDSVKAVITDLMMPVMNGLALIKALQGIRPELPIIATTGLDHGAKQAELAAMGIKETLLKPCNGGQLTAALRRVLA